MILPVYTFRTLPHSLVSSGLRTGETLDGLNFEGKMTYTTLCRKQVLRSIRTQYFACAFRMEDGVMFAREFEYITINLN
jgi:hypothetical protein